MRYKRMMPLTSSYSFEVFRLPRNPLVESQYSIHTSERWRTIAGVRVLSFDELMAEFAQKLLGVAQRSNAISDCPLLRVLQYRTVGTTK